MKKVQRRRCCQEREHATPRHSCTVHILAWCTLFGLVWV
eukprot:gene18192-biopygen15963